MSNVALTWARSLDSEWSSLPRGADQVKAAFLLHVLCDAANDDLLVWLAAETIAQRTRIRSRNTIAKYLAHLEDLGLIHDTGERRRSGSRDRGGAKTYRVMVDPNPAARRDCSTWTEQSPPGEIAQHRVSNHPAAPAVEIAQSAGEIAQFRGGDCSLQSEHEARKLQSEAVARGRAREAAAAVCVTEYRPPPDVVAEIERMRPDLVPTLASVIDGFRRYGWKRRRSESEWSRALLDWCAREGAPAAPGGGGRQDAAWIRARVATLLRMPDGVLEQQLADDPVMAVVFESAGGPAAVAKLPVRDLVERYQLARGEVAEVVVAGWERADPHRSGHLRRRTASDVVKFPRVAR